MNSDVMRQLLNVAALAATVLVNYLANALPLGGRDTREISDMFDVLFTPAPYVFAIWGVIYLSLIVFAIYQALPSQRDNPALRRVGYLFALSCALNIGWLFAWHYLLIGLSLIIMLALLATLITIYLRLEVGRAPAPWAESVAVRLPFRIYLGWISVATVANVSIFLYHAGWGGWGLTDVTWTLIAFGLATALGLAMLLRRGDSVYNLVLVWAFVGIAVARWDLPLIAAGALAAAGLLTALVTFRLWTDRSERAALV